MKDTREMEARRAEIIALTDKVCAERLDGEYRDLAREMVNALRKEDPAILAHGDPRIIACGVIYALGYVNFLFDPNNRPYLSVNDLCDAFGVKQSSAYNKSRTIREALDLMQLDPDWCLPSMIDDNPLVWMVEVDGIVLDAHMLPREAQESLASAGIIPYVPKSKSSDSYIERTAARSADQRSDTGKGGAGRREQDPEIQEVDTSQLNLGFDGASDKGDREGE